MSSLLPFEDSPPGTQGDTRSYPKSSNTTNPRARSTSSQLPQQPLPRSPPPPIPQNTAYSSPPPKSFQMNSSTSYSSVSSTAHDHEQAHEMQDLNGHPKHDADTSGSYAFKPPQPAYQQPLQASPSKHGRDSSEASSESDGMTVTDSEDEFDWDEDENEKKEKEDATGMVRGKHRAKRGRRVYLWLMSLSRWFRSVDVRGGGSGKGGNAPD